MTDKKAGPVEPTSHHVLPRLCASIVCHSLLPEVRVYRGPPGCTVYPTTEINNAAAAQPHTTWYSSTQHTQHIIMMETLLCSIHLLTCEPLLVGRPFQNLSSVYNTYAGAIHDNITGLGNLPTRMHAPCESVVHETPTPKTQGREAIICRFGIS